MYIQSECTSKVYLAATVAVTAAVAARLPPISIEITLEIAPAGVDSVSTSLSARDRAPDNRRPSITASEQSWAVTCL